MALALVSILVVVVFVIATFFRRDLVFKFPGVMSLITGIAHSFSIDSTILDHGKVAPWHKGIWEILSQDPLLTLRWINAQEAELH